MIGLERLPGSSHPFFTASTGFFNPGSAPAVCSNLLACKQRASASGFLGFASVQLTIGAVLLFAVFGVFFCIHFGSVCGITQSHSCRVFFAEQGRSLSQRVGSCTCGGRNGD